MKINPKMLIFKRKNLNEITITARKTSKRTKINNVKINDFIVYLKNFSLYLFFTFPDKSCKINRPERPMILQPELRDGGYSQERGNSTLEGPSLSPPRRLDPLTLRLPDQIRVNVLQACWEWNTILLFPSPIYFSSLKNKKSDKREESS